MSLRSSAHQPRQGDLEYVRDLFRHFRSAAGVSLLQLTDGRPVATQLLSELGLCQLRASPSNEEPLRELGPSRVSRDGHVDVVTQKCSNVNVRD